MATTDEPLSRKNFRLPQSKIDKAKAILGTETETETVERALDLVAFGEQITAGLDAMRGAEWIDVFADGDEATEG